MQNKPLDPKNFKRRVYFKDQFTYVDGLPINYKPEEPKTEEQIKKEHDDMMKKNKVIQPDDYMTQDDDD